MSLILDNASCVADVKASMELGKIEALETVGLTRQTSQAPLSNSFDAYIL